MDILPGRLFFVYTENLKATTVNQQRFTIFAYSSSSLTCMMHARDDEPYKLEKTASIPMQCDKFISDPTLNAVH